MSTAETTPPPKATPPEKVEASAPSFEKSFIDQITNHFSDDLKQRNYLQFLNYRTDFYKNAHHRKNKN